jgi:hypothetical protein
VNLVAKCNCDHDRLVIDFDPELAKSLADAWAGGGPESVNLRGASRAKLLHVAAYCLTAAADYQDENDQGRFCWRLYYCGVDIVNKLVKYAFRGAEDLDAVKFKQISGDARCGGWEG